MAPSDLDLERIATRARKRRQQLGLALNDANAAAGGTSKKTWQRIEKGLPIRAMNYVKVDGLLEWAPGSLVAIGEGKEPIPVKPSESTPGVTISEIPPELIDEEVRDVVKLAAIATTEGLTVEQVRELSDRVVRDLRKNGLLGD
ncbi:hypothetical protein ACFUJR_07195 [Streptomyces sp. NPDC057271]|uniref:hypothetical protein n=1 Tax=unclassified Streptomyces TaxID=2593676 RepID=UPI0036373D96